MLVMSRIAITADIVVVVRVSPSASGSDDSARVSTRFPLISTGPELENVPIGGAANRPTEINTLAATKEITRYRIFITPRTVGILS